MLFRTGHDSALLELELARRDIPFVKYGGLRYLDAAHVKDLLALLRLVDNPADELAWFRVLQLLDGVGPARARRILHGARVLRGAQADGGLGRRAASRCRRALARSRRACSRPFAHARSQAEPCTGAQVEALCGAIEPLIRLRYHDGAIRVGDLRSSRRRRGRRPSCGASWRS